MLTIFPRNFPKLLVANVYVETAQEKRERRTLTLKMFVCTQLTGRLLQKMEGNRRKICPCLGMELTR